MSDPSASPTLNSNKARTRAIQESLLNRGDLHPLSFFDTREYVQHNLQLENGVGAILAFVDALPPERTRATVKRAFEDGDISFAHADYELGDWGRMTGFEVHRWKDGRIVEHWDNLQPTPAGPNASGHAMSDGPSDPGDPARTEESKQLVEEFTREVLIDRDFSQLPRFFRDGALIQHSPEAEDGMDALRRDLEGGRARRRVLHKVLGEGAFVLVMSEGDIVADDGARQPSAFYDLFRVEDGAIAEHWDVIEPTPPREEWRNDNGKF